MSPLVEFVAPWNRALTAADMPCATLRDAPLEYRSGDRGPFGTRQPPRNEHLCLFPRRSCVRLTWKQRRYAAGHSRQCQLCIERSCCCCTQRHAIGEEALRLDLAGRRSNGTSSLSATKNQRNQILQDTPCFHRAKAHAGTDCAVGGRCPLQCQAQCIPASPRAMVGGRELSTAR